MMAKWKKVKLVGFSNKIISDPISLLTIHSFLKDLMKKLQIIVLMKKIQKIKIRINYLLSIGWYKKKVIK